MNIDFHYYTVKVLARAAGFDEREAQIIAYASQYTDDATLHEPVPITNADQAREMDDLLGAWIGRLAEHTAAFQVDPGRGFVTDEGGFDPICTAHSDIESKLMTLLKQFQWDLLVDELKELLGANTQKKVYIPFHFVPYEIWSGADAQQYPFAVQRNSEILRQLLAACGNAYQQYPGDLALVAMGCAVHSLADTWAHEGFSGRLNKQDNDIEDLFISSDDYQDDREVGVLPELGHIEAKSYPDSSNIGLRFRFDHAVGDREPEVDRNNFDHFLEAARAIHEALASACGNGEAVGFGEVEAALKAFLCYPSDYDLDDRIQELAGDLTVCFDPGISLSYDSDTWEGEVEDGAYTYAPDSLWFQFHIAAAAQRAVILGALPGIH